MSLSAKTTVSLAIILFLISGCSETPSLTSGQTTVNFSKANPAVNNITQLEISKSDYLDKNEQVYIADVGNGRITQGSFFVKLSFKNSYPEKKIYTVKDSASGDPAKTRTEIQLFRFYLVDSNGASLTNTNLKTPAFDITSSSSGTLGTLFTTLKAGSTGTLKIINVSTGTYYFAAAAFNSTTVIDSTTNISNLSTTPAGSSTNIIISGPSDLGRFALSTSGGDLPGLNGVVTVGADLTLTNGGTAPLGLSLSLADVKGADIESGVIVNGGSTIVPAVTAQ
mgnify:CR=1 FL=1